MFNFSYQILQNQKRQPFIHFFSFVLNVILKLSRIFDSIKYHLCMRVKDFFYYNEFFLKSSLIYYDFNDILMNVL